MKTPKLILFQVFGIVFYRIMFLCGIGVTLAYHRIRQALSHTCHTGVDETVVFMGIFTNVETWCDG
jgi:hypothetical protein